MRSTWLMMMFGGTLIAGFLAQSGCAQQQATAPASGDWPMYRHDLAGTGYSPLAQITAGNVGTLSRLWTYALHSEAPAAGTDPERPSG